MKLLKRARNCSEKMICFHRIRNRKKTEPFWKMKLAKPAGDCSKTSVFTSKSEKTGWAGALSTEWLEGAADLIPDKKKIQ